MDTKFWTRADIERIAHRMAHERQPWLTPDAIEEFGRFIDALYHREVQRTGYLVRFVPYQPYTSKGYPSLKEMREHVTAMGVLWIADEGAGNSWLLNSRRNLRFRAIHDIHHLDANANFSVEGETRAAIHMMRLVPEEHASLFRNLIFSEIIGQRCYYEVHREYMSEQRVLLGWDADIARLLSTAANAEHEFAAMREV
jgi:hypothetical protein